MIVGLYKDKIYKIVKNDDGEVTVNGGDGTKVVSSSVASDGEKSENRVVAYCDEYVQLYDGKILKRLRDALSVENALKY